MKRTESNFKQVMNWFATASILVLLVSCSAETEDKIVGKWSEIDGTETMEFLKDGTLSVVDGGMSMGGKYEFVEKDKVRLELGGLGALMGPILAGVAMTGDELTFTMPDGKVSKYKRVE